MAGESAIENLTTGPVLRTRVGCRARVLAMSIGERWRLAKHFGLDIMEWDFEEQIARRLHDLNHKKRTSRTAGTWWTARTVLNRKS